MRRIIVPRRPTARLFALIARKIPFTLVIVAAILIVTTVTGSILRPLTEEQYRVWGYGFDTLERWRWQALILTMFQVSRPYVVLTVSATLLLMLGACEYILGTWRAMLVFTVSHVVGYVGADLVLRALLVAGANSIIPLTQQYDVGASAAAFGAAGAVLPFLPSRMRKILFALIVMYLVIFLLTSRAIWDIEHLLAFPIGLLMGLLFLRKRGGALPALMPSPMFPEWQRPLLIGWLIAIMGFVNILSTFVSPQRTAMTWLENTLPLSLTHGGRHLTLLIGFALLVLAFGLARGNRQSWYLTVLALVVSIVLHVFKGGGLLEAIIALGLLLLLMAWRMSFVARSDPPSLRQGYRAMLVLLVLLPVYSIAGFFLLQSEFDVAFRLEYALLEMFQHLLFNNAGIYEITNRRTGWFLGSIPILGWGGLLYVLVLLGRRVLATRPVAADLERAQQLLSEFGVNNSSYMTLWADNTYYFACGRQVYICYRLEVGIAVGLGDPIGPDALLEQAIDEFASVCQERGWVLTFFGASDRIVSRYRNQGFHDVKIGEEALIPLPQLSLRGKSWQDFRTALNRATREGITFQMYEGGNVPEEVREQIFAISEQWVGGKGLPEMSFTLGTASDIDDPNLYVTVALDAEGRVHAFSDWLPMYAIDGWVIDLMRRRADAFNGAMEFLIVSSLLAFKERGHRVASLSLAPLANVSPDEDESLIQRLLGVIYERFNTYYHFQSLFSFKKKFQPQWQAAYLIYEDHADLPRIGLALVRVHLPGLNPLSVAELLGSSLAQRITAVRQRQES